MSGNNCVGWFQCLTVILTLIASSSSSGVAATATADDAACGAAAADDAACGAVAGGAVAGGAVAGGALVEKIIKSCFVLVVLELVRGQLSDQIHDRFTVPLHVGTALRDVALDVAAGGGSGGSGGCPWADEDANVVAVVLVVLGDDASSSSCPSCTPTANCATVPSAVD